MMSSSTNEEDEWSIDSSFSTGAVDGLGQDDDAMNEKYKHNANKSGSSNNSNNNNTTRNDDLEISLTNSKYKEIILVRAKIIALDNDNSRAREIGIEIVERFKKTGRRFIELDGHRVVPVSDKRAENKIVKDIQRQATKMRKNPDTASSGTKREVSGGISLREQVERDKETSPKARLDSHEPRSGKKRIRNSNDSTEDTKRSGEGNSKIACTPQRRQCMMRAELKGAEEESTCGSDDVDISLSNPEYKGIIMLHVNKILLEKDNRTYKIIGTEIAGIFKKTKRNFIRRDGSKVIQVGEVDAIDKIVKDLRRETNKKRKDRSYMKKIKAAAREGASPQPPNKSDDIDERKRSREVIATENAFIESPRKKTSHQNETTKDASNAQRKSKLASSNSIQLAREQYTHEGNDSNNIYCHQYTNNAKSTINSTTMSIEDSNNGSNYQDPGNANMIGEKDRKPPAVSEIKQYMQIYELIKKKLADAEGGDAANAVIFYGHLKKWFQHNRQINCNDIQTCVDCFENAMQKLSSHEDDGDAFVYETCVKNIIEACKADFPLPNDDFV